MNLKELISHVRSVAPDMQAVSAWLSRQDAPGLRAAVCESLLADGALLQAVAARSYRHPNGFDKLIVHAESGFTLRLHIWWPETSAAAEHIHSHRWDYATLVLAGAYAQEVFDHTPTAGARRLCRHVDTPAEATGGVYTHRYVDEVALALASGGVLTRGATAFQRAHVPHRITEVDRIAATLFVQGPFLTENSYVYTGQPLSARDCAVASNHDRCIDVQATEASLRRLLTVVP